MFNVYAKLYQSLLSTILQADLNSVVPMQTASSVLFAGQKSVNIF